MDEKMVEELASYRALLQWAVDLLHRRGVQTWTQNEGQFVQDTQRTLGAYPDRPMPALQRTNTTRRIPQ